MKYICEVCNKKFDTQEEALVCEAKHEEERKRQQSLKKEKEERSRQINDLMKRYYEDYKELPAISFLADDKNIHFDLFKFLFNNF